MGKESKLVAIVGGSDIHAHPLILVSATILLSGVLFGFLAVSLEKLLVTQWFVLFSWSGTRGLSCGLSSIFLDDDSSELTYIFCPSPGLTSQQGAPTANLMAVATFC